MFLTYEQIDKNLDRYDWGFDEDDEGFVSEMLAGECSELFIAFMRENGLEAQPTGVTFDPTKLDVIIDMANAISFSLDTPNQSLFDRFGLTSDDDVDYNGGYIVGLIVAIRASVVDGG